MEEHHGTEIWIAVAIATELATLLTQGTSRTSIGILWTLDSSVCLCTQAQENEWAPFARQIAPFFLYSCCHTIEC